MITRVDILWLGLAAGVSGSLVGGMMLGIGWGLLLQGVAAGWLLLPAGALAGAGLGYLLAQRLAAKLPAKAEH